MPSHNLERRIRLLRQWPFVVASMMVITVPQFGFGQDSTDAPKAANDAAAVQQTDAKTEPAKPVTNAAVVSLTERQRLAARRQMSQQTSAELVAASRSAFVRGLLPVEDYAERLNGARELELAAIDADDHSARAAVMQRHAEMWTAAVERVRRFRQPASRGWASDLSYAQMMRATLQSYVAEETGNSAAGRAATLQRTVFAQQQFDRRLADLDVGLATLSQVAESLSQLRQTAGGVEAAYLAAAVRSQLDDRLQLAGTEIKARIETLQEQPAGISRRDAMQRIQYELEMTAADESARSEKEAEVAARASDAYRAAAQMSATEGRLYREGRTATLADLSRSWRLRRDAVARYQPDADKPRVTEFDAEMKTGLARLVSLAGTIEDRRGRNEADVLYVRSLDVMAEWQAERVAAAEAVVADKAKR